MTGELGELAPKTLALERAEKVALAISWPMQAFYKIFRWPIRALDWAGMRTVRLERSIHGRVRRSYRHVLPSLSAKALSETPT